MSHTKIVLADLDSPCQELSVRGIRSVLALLVRWNLFCTRVYWGSNPDVGPFS